VLSGLLVALCLAVVKICVHAEVRRQAVGSDRARWHNGLSDECMQSGPGRVWDRAQTNAADALSVFLCRHDNQGLEFRASADCAGFLTAPVGLIHLDDAIQPVAARACHGATQLMQHRLGGLATAQIEDALQTQSTDAILLAGDLPHGA
jgi:hypothetical protein